jgi:hypothetical protein
MKYFDSASAVLKWSSEEIAIPYKSPIDPTSSKKKRRYYPDFVIYAKTKNGKNKVTMIEVKPEKQTIPPPVPKRKTKKYWAACMRYAVNMAKWKAAEIFCKSKGWDWRIMTEHHIYG